MAKNPFDKVKKKRKESKIFRISSTIVIAVILLVLVGILSVFAKRAIMEHRANLTKPDTVEGDYYFNGLSWKDQQLYNEIVEAATECKEGSDIIPYSYDMDTFENVIKCVMADRPDLFYVDFSSLVLNHASSKTKITMTYFAGGKKLQTLISDYKSSIEEALKDISGESQFELELAVHDYICGHCDYAIGQTDRLYNTAYGALVYKSAYCDGYAYATKALLDGLGVESTIVYGSVDGSDHVWNIVKIDGDYYHLDVMWDDGNLTNNENFRFHGYFNLTDEKICLDHSFEDYDFIPDCTTEKTFYDSCASSCKTLAETEEILYYLLVDAANDNNRDYIELYCEESVANDLIAPYFKKAVARYNEKYGTSEETDTSENNETASEQSEKIPVFLDAFRVYNASKVTNTITIQIFYN